MRPIVVGNVNEGYCKPCWDQRKAELASKTNGEYKVEDQIAINRKAHLNSKQNGILKRRKAKQQEICEENWGGHCQGGCGKVITGQFTCNDCKKKKAETNFTLNEGEVELFRGNVGNADDKFVRQVVAIEALSLKPQKMTWLWKERIPDGAITWIVGQPGNAKSLLTIEIVACATAGKPWPDGTPNTMGAMKVLMFCGEDDLTRTVVPRLMAAGADLSKVRFLDNRSFRGTLGDSKVPGRSIDLDQDMETLLGMLKANPDTKLLICDPITGVFGSKKISKDEEVNPILEELVDLCKVTGLTFVGVSHTPKRTTNSSIEKISGGSAVAGKCRAAFMLSHDPESEDKHDHVMTIIKGNLTGNLSGMKYSTVPCSVQAEGEAIDIVKIEWKEATDLTADDVLIAQNSKKEERDGQVDKCMAFLQTYLKEPTRSPTVYDAGMAHPEKFVDKTIQRALKKLGGRHIDGRLVGKGKGFWMALAGQEFPEPKSEKLMALAADEAL
jgi:putative DNA primase/helicase